MLHLSCGLTVEDIFSALKLIGFSSGGLRSVRIGLYMSTSARDGLDLAIADLLGGRP